MTHKPAASTKHHYRIHQHKTSNKRSRTPSSIHKPAQYKHKHYIINIAYILILATLLTGIGIWAYWNRLLTTAQETQEQLERHYDFNPGNIISDQQFFDANAMTREEVRTFIQTQGKQCNGTECLRNKHFHTETIAASSLCSQYQGANNESAADIIDKSARACSISQKVLLTMLQKEQHLITETHPKPFQYRSAMGLSCPDDDHCDPKYAGFARQVFGAAQRYRYYLAHEKDYNYHPYTLNTIQFHPRSVCGSSNVYIKNKATALLYIYTPYQPNIAALRAGSHEGNACSSYGNRNFSLIYKNWFGNPRD